MLLTKRMAVEVEVARPDPNGLCLTLEQPPLAESAAPGYAFVKISEAVRENIVNDEDVRGAAPKLDALPRQLTTER